MNLSLAGLRGQITCLLSELFSALALMRCISSTLWLSGPFRWQKARIGGIEGSEEGKPRAAARLLRLAGAVIITRPRGFSPEFPEPFRPL